NSFLTYSKSSVVTAETILFSPMRGSMFFMMDSYLNLIAYGYRNASPKLATSIEAASRTFVGKKPLKREMLVFPHPGNEV
ncbi:MAG: hypothetical protein E7I26_17015, partial [Enterococcus faecalis]|nr:hypothetical protein [Enterococcus faecalis]